MKEIWFRIKAKNNPENNATTLPTIITQFPKKTPTNMVQTNQSRLFSADCYKDSYKDNFSFKIKDQKKDTLSIALQNGTKFQRPLYFRNCNSAGWLTIQKYS
jgi:hypothetical protein